MPVTSGERDARFAELVTALRSFKPHQFDPFHIYNSCYESTGQKIGVDIMVPKNGPTPSRRPVLVRIHGGFLVTGSSLFPAWFSKWILEYAEMHGAVIISPDYRLLPEVKGDDILDDMTAFWEWYYSGGPRKVLETVARKDVELDLDRYLLVGESAGGYLTIQSVLSNMAYPKAMIALYPMLDMRSKYYNKSYEKTIVNVPNFPNKLIDDFIDSATNQTPITTAEPPERLELAMAMCHNGRYVEFFGEEPHLFPLERLEMLAREHQGKPLLPPILVTQGSDDTAVPARGTINFVDELTRVSPWTDVKLVIKPGEHGFDCFSTLEDAWLKEALEHVNIHWLGNTEARV